MEQDEGKRGGGFVVVAAVFGMVCGIGFYTFGYARGASYLSDNPESCKNCHVMNEHFDGWVKGSHRKVATCNDCHAPHDLIGKYATKARNGFWHSYYFTTGTFKEPIRISDKNRAITEASCRHCHSEVVSAMDGPHKRQPAACLTCHAGVGHGY